jgi:predicted GTPase
MNDVTNVLEFSQNLMHMIRRAKSASLIGVNKVCVILNGQMQKHYEELGKTYSRAFESWSLATQDTITDSTYIHKEWVMSYIV